MWRISMASNLRNDRLLFGPASGLFGKLIDFSSDQHERKNFDVRRTVCEIDGARTVHDWPDGHRSHLHSQLRLGAYCPVHTDYHTVSSFFTLLHRHSFS